jgi:glycosyltransferase involved in cell wall biosynthesis
MTVGSHGRTVSGDLRRTLKRREQVGSTPTDVDRVGRVRPAARRRPHVLIAYKSLPNYRVQFFERLRERLADDGIELALVYGQGTARDAHRNEGAHVTWGIQRSNRVLHAGGRELVWQPCLGEARRADLVVVEQASRLVVNYFLLAGQRFGLGNVAFWGHGANLQKHTASPTSEWLKRKVSRLPHWWFAYTDGSKARVAALGYPPERITVVQNAQDTELLAAAVAAVSSSEKERFRAEHGLGSGPVGLFLGSLSREKRIEFLLDSASRVAAVRPDFRLLVVGDGEARENLVAAAAVQPWVKYLGRVDALHERALALAVSDVVLMPGLVGLVALDSFAARVPLMTTAVNFHSPEFEYIEDGVNGIVAPDPNDVAAYAALAVEVMTSEQRRGRLVQGCADASRTFTLGAMVDRFADGLHSALETR